MKKFEEIAQGELTNANIIYEAYPIDYKEGIPEGGLVLTNRNCIYRFPWLEFVKNWHSDEEFQLLLRDRDTLKQGNDNLFKNHLELVRENDELKSQPKQQALPEIPEFVADEIEEKNRRFSDFHKTANIEGYVKDVRDWYYEKPYHAELFYRAILDGYTVAKEKRFYLKHIDFCKRHKDYDWYMIKHSDGPLNHLRVEKGTLPPTVDTYFTKQEIDSMETGSYEQIEVVK